MMAEADSSSRLFSPVPAHHRITGKSFKMIAAFALIQFHCSSSMAGISSLSTKSGIPLIEGCRKFIPAGKTLSQN